MKKKKLRYEFLVILLGFALVVCVSSALTYEVIVWKGVLVPMAPSQPTNVSDDISSDYSYIRQQVGRQESSIEALQQKLQQMAQSPVQQDTLRELIEGQLVADETEQKGSAMVIHPLNQTLVSFSIPLSIWNKYPGHEIDVGDGSDIGPNIWTLQLLPLKTSAYIQYGSRGLPAVTVAVREAGLYEQPLESSPSACDPKKYPSDVISFDKYLIATSTFALPNDASLCDRIESSKKPLTSTTGEAYVADTLRRKPGEPSSMPYAIVAAGIPDQGIGFVASFNYGVTGETSDATRQADAEAVISSFLNTAVHSICTNDYAGC